MNRRALLTGLLATVALPALEPVRAFLKGASAGKSTIMLDTDGIAWTASGGTPGPFRTAVFYDNAGPIEQVWYTPDGAVESRQWLRAIAYDPEGPPDTDPWDNEDLDIGGDPGGYADLEDGYDADDLPL